MAGDMTGRPWRGIRWLGENHFPSTSETNIYYWYYATQVMHHHGGAEWDEWNQRMRHSGEFAGNARPFGRKLEAQG